MNGPVNAKKFETDASYCKFGCETVLRQLEVFEKQIDGVIENKDIEYVHKMRVASRRIRAALPLFRFCFPAKDFKKWRREIKKVTRLLANARDLDVQIAFIDQYVESIKPEIEHTGIDLLLKHHKNQRKKVQLTVVEGLEKLTSTCILNDIWKLCDQTIKQQVNVAFNLQKVLEKAHWLISFRLDDFLAMEKYVHIENEILKHHQMRIYAKKLRYTMEHFARLYADKLENEIETIKAFQDVLGEMHDCDVRSEFIPKFVKETQPSWKRNKKLDPSKVEKELLSFLTYIRQKRKENYSQFVSLWDKTQKDGFFVQLRRTTSVGLAMKDKRIKARLNDPEIKIAVISDVHANLVALESAIQNAEERGADFFLNAGDSIGFGPCPNEVIELLCEKDVLSVLGNYDLEVIEGITKEKGPKNISLKFARKELSKSCKDYLQSLPRELRLEVAGKKLLITHGSPESIDEHIYQKTSSERLTTLARTAKADIIIVGHSHEQLLRDVNGVAFVNPGSVGRPGNGNPQAAFAMLMFNPFRVEMIRLEYNVGASAQSLRKKSLPESFSQMLLRGVSLETILREDAERENSSIEECKALVDSSRDFASIYLQESNHNLQVTKLALELFDGLISLHQFGMQERCWLECAAMMHDVGLSKGVGGHHKESAKLILNDTQLPFTSTERRIVASIARYHRKGLPKQKNYNLKALNRQTVNTIIVLASLLRVADSLDFTHQSNAKILTFKVSSKKVVVECTCESPSDLEEQAFNKKKDLFEKVFAKKLVLIWKQP